jgi:hypothetical protein
MHLLHLEPVFNVSGISHLGFDGYLPGKRLLGSLHLDNLIAKGRRNFFKGLLFGLSVDESADGGRLAKSSSKGTYG